jgi:hypothetical protein
VRALKERRCCWDSRGYSYSREVRSPPMFNSLNAPGASNDNARKMEGNNGM